MADVRNILVGAAQLFVSRGTGAYRPVTAPGYTVATASALNSAYSNNSNLATAKGDINSGSVSMKTYLGNQPTFWRDLGYTNNGLEVSYEPGYNDVMVDQLLDAARLFKSTLKVMLTTELTEATLENVNLVFGQNEQDVAWSGSVATNPAVLKYDGTAGAASATLALEAGALGDAPVERSLVAVGNAPVRFGATGVPANTGGSAGFSNPAGGDQTTSLKERVYVARRVVQVQSSSHGLKRDAATVFPVQFRCLPDDIDLYDGAEYGVIIDRVYNLS